MNAPAAFVRAALGLSGSSIAALAVTGCIAGAPANEDEAGGARASGGRGDLLSTVGGAGGRGGRAGGGSGNDGGQSGGGGNGGRPRAAGTSQPTMPGPEAGVAGSFSAGGAGSAGGAPAGPRSVCADVTTTRCTLGQWPDGVVAYEFGDGFTDKQAVRAAMDRWEAASARTIRFVEDATRRAKVTIVPCSGGAEPGGYEMCTNGCTAELCGDGIDHALGHVLGLRHEHERHDRDHYVRIQARCSDTTSGVQRCGLDDNLSDLGPFDYGSSMLGPVIDPDYTRWDGTPICPGYAGLPCPTSATAPHGHPTAGDGAAIIDLYQRPLGWTKFVRTSAGPDSLPYDPSLQKPVGDEPAPAVSFPRTSSPAVETWGGASLAIYVTGSDGNVYKKWLGGDAWSPWESLGAPSGSGPVSDPAIVSWASGRADLVVQRGGMVYIMSTPTWSTWQPLRALPKPAASAPAITSWGENQLDVFVRGADDRVYHSACTADCAGNAGTWSTWEIVGTATIRGKPAAVARATGTIDVFAHAMGDNLWSARYVAVNTPPWGDWHLVDGTPIAPWDATCPDCSSPAAGSRDGTTADVYVRTPSGAIVTGSVRADGAFTGYTVLGGVASGSPAVVAAKRDINRVDLVTLMPEEQRPGELHYATWWKTRTF